MLGVSRIHYPSTNFFLVHEKNFLRLFQPPGGCFIVFEIVSMRKLSCDVFENFSCETGTEELCVHCRLCSDLLQLSIYVGKK